ncbi:hypothetical protein AOG2_20410 [Geobacter sp. AOG2]|nr:hypothetical protein AOG2_20410 [Geobacter sp. AOG2]
MEFFRCPCPLNGNVILDGADLGPNKDDSGRPLTKLCNAGFHTISLLCPAGKRSSPLQVTIEITGTDPSSPLEVPFQCVG